MTTNKNTNRKYGFIYLTTNTLDGKKYIGQRKYHYDNPRSDIDYYGSGNMIRFLIRKFGRGIFTKKILEECDTQESLNDRERYWISKYDAVRSPDFYNIHEGGNAGNTWEGQSEEYKSWFKSRIAKSNKSRKRDVTKISGSKNPAFGRHWYKDTVNHKQYYLFETDPLIEELGLCRGMFRTKEHNEKISIANRGKKKNYVVASTGRRWMHKPGSRTREDSVFVMEQDIQHYIDIGYVFGMKDK